MLLKTTSAHLWLIIVLVCFHTHAWSKEVLEFYLEEDFQTAMIGLEQEREACESFFQRITSKALYTKIKKQYQTYVAQVEQLYKSEPRIPKIIHQIWVGPYPFPKEAYEWQQSWLQLHPDWEYKLWTNEDVEALDFENKKYYDEALNWGEKADILRYELLYRFGGVYVDVDQKCIKSFDFLHHTCDFYAGIHALPLMYTGKNKIRIANGVIAAKPDHPILKCAVENIKHNRKLYQVVARTGPEYFTRMVALALDPASTDVIFPANYFYPSAQRFTRAFKIKPTTTVYIKPETIAVHYYTSYWLSAPKDE